MCAYHRQVIFNLADKDHVGDEVSYRVAVQIKAQCPDCRNEV